MCSQNPTNAEQSSRSLEAFCLENEPLVDSSLNRDTGVEMFFDDRPKAEPSSLSYDTQMEKLPVESLEAFCLENEPLVDSSLNRDTGVEMFFDDRPKAEPSSLSYDTQMEELPVEVIVLATGSDQEGSAIEAPGWDERERRKKFLLATGSDQEGSAIEASGWDGRDVSDFFDDVAKGDLKKIKSWLSRIQRNKWQMDELREKETGKTCLMKALLNPMNNSPETTEEIVTSLIDCAKGSGCLKKLLDASFTATEYEGQTALHIAIEKRLDRIVKLLVENGADVHIQAKGTFFQPLTCRDDCFYFGEYPLSQAACTNQPKLVEFLLDKVSNPYAQDSLGNTVLHALVMVADDSEENTAFVTEIYDQILKASEKKCIETRNESKKNLEKILNKEGLTPLQLAATYGKIKVQSAQLSNKRRGVCHVKGSVSWHGENLVKG
ncbi:transient receptor potential cation channel subfamily V member 1-like [Pelodiscus sinensis]|uniref:transient receptor potential cation channel subfamily V member 1-like n=1 Tax=Pelodiscus sinensis TaxID=13735 RepID=UPI003F6BB27F